MGCVNASQPQIPKCISNQKEDIPLKMSIQKVYALIWAASLTQLNRIAKKLI